jgi:hypothetical protein
MIEKEAESILRYKDIKMEVQHMLNIKKKVIPVVHRGNWNHVKPIKKTEE